jgi:hypothetical protein
MGGGPLGSDTNSPISDPGTSVRGPSPSTGPLCLVTSPNNRAEVQEIWVDLDYTTQRAAAARNQMRSYLSGLPPNEKKLAQDDLHRLDVIEIITNDRFSRLLDGSSRDPRDFNQSFQLLWESMLAVELGNERYRTARVAGSRRFALELVTLLVNVTEQIQKAAAALPGEITELVKQLERAQKDVTGADAQMAINGVLFVALKLLEGAVPPIAAVDVFLRAGAFTVAVMANDRLLGPGSSHWADLDVAAGSLIEALPHGVAALSHSIKQFAGKASALGTLAFDVHEIHEAKEIVENLKKKVEHVKQELEMIDRWLTTNLPKLPGLRKAIAALKEAGASAGVEAVEADRIYWKHKSEMQQ